MLLFNVKHQTYLCLQLKGWYSKDDVVAEWTNVNGELFLNIHCYVSGPNPLSAMAAELRYLIFSKELPLVSIPCRVEFM